MKKNLTNYITDLSKYPTLAESTRLLVSGCDFQWLLLSRRYQKNSCRGCFKGL